MHSSVRYKLFIDKQTLQSRLNVFMYAIKSPFLSMSESWTHWRNKIISENRKRKDD